MIEFNSVINFDLINQSYMELWLTSVVAREEKILGEINYIFCDDDYLHKINIEFLEHDTLTDIISFDYSVGNIVSGDIYISIERVEDNCSDFQTSFRDELSRVMVHGVLHYCGYKDKTSEEAKVMRVKENSYLALR